MPVVDSPPNPPASIDPYRNAPGNACSKESVHNNNPSDGVFHGFSFVASCVLHETKFEDFYRRHRQNTAASGSGRMDGVAEDRP